MKKVLIIEDDAVLMEILTVNLRHAGHEVIQATDGINGLIMALREKPDLVLLDILLPNMDGLTMLDKLRKNPEGKKIPIMILSNLSAPADVATAIRNDVHQYLVKVDWKMEDVLKKINEELER